MALNLYRRHFRSGCPAGHTPDSQTYESDEVRPKWKKCGCPIYASGKLGDNPKFRKNTKRIHWSEAREVAQAWERGELNPPPPAPSTPPPSGKRRVTLAEAIAEHDAEYKISGYAKGTMRRYGIVLGKLTAFASDVRGYVYLDEWTFQDLAQFREWWKGCSERTHNTNMGLAKSFFEWCRRDREYLKANPWAGRRRRRNVAQLKAVAPKEKTPFTDAELSRMLAACDRFNSWTSWGRTGEDLRDFILVSVYTGLRISDVASFHISRLSAEGDVHVRAIKNGKWVDTWVPEWLEDIIRKRAEKFGPYIFGARTTTDPQVLGEPWRQRLRKLWKLCGEWEKTPTPHRFRHTFARILLEHGSTVSEVANLLGITEETVRQCYASWNPERQQRMREALQKAFRRAPLHRV